MWYHKHYSRFAEKVVKTGVFVREAATQLRAAQRLAPRAFFGAGAQ
jgi:hypothetical protein